MLRRFTGIAVGLILVFTMPVSHACAILSPGAKVQHECCQHKVVDVCCGSSLGCNAQAPVDTTPSPVQYVSTLIPPPITVAVAYPSRLDCLESCQLALYSPEQQEPPGLLIAATIVLRI